MTAPKSVAVVGAGTMGNGIAQTFAAHGVSTYLIDIKDEFLQRGMGAIEKSLARFVKKEKITQAQADEITGRIECSTSMEAASGVDLLVEAVTERVEVKSDFHFYGTLGEEYADFAPKGIDVKVLEPGDSWSLD